MCSVYEFVYINVVIFTILYHFMGMYEYTLCQYYNNIMFM